MSRILDEDFLTIEELNQNGLWPREFSSVSGLIPYIKRLGQNVEGIEIGTEKGESAYTILTQCQNVSKLYTIDHYEPWTNWNGEVPQESQDKYKVIAEKNLSEFGDRVSTVEVSTNLFATVDGFFEESMDFIFIDGDPSEEQIIKDLETFYPFLKPKGLLCGHNIQFKTVFNGVKKFRDDNKIRQPLNKSTNGTYFWYK